ncbi:endonuclease VII domain-containing protein [Blastococcus montanus]|uniref:endonuclease VII domain-containing protein n=1 Tax=Blastococcus montanus TaxID=3144973 RepID=UPI00320A88C7
MVVPEGSKWCPDCGTVQPLLSFPRTRASASGYATYCLPCHNERGKASRAKIGGSRTYHLTRRYGITAAEADVMLAAQGGLCALCRTAPAEHVDHDHETGAVRALLCFNCNGGLGQFRDDPELLHVAAFYVEHHRQQQVLALLAQLGAEEPDGPAEPVARR